MLGVLVATLLALLAALLLAAWVFSERGALLLPSTRAWIEEAGGLRALLTYDFWHGYVYARYADMYIGRAMQRLFPRTQPAGDGDPRWAAQYHGKVLPHELARRLITVDQSIPYRELEQVVPYETARGLVLNAPLEVAAYECPCRANREHPCRPTQVCMVMGQPFVDFMLEHHATTTRRLTQDEALELLAGEHQRGHVHVAYFKDAMLDRFYAICNCCSCCCGGIESMLRCGVPMVMSSGYVAQVDDQLCAGCGTCADACHFRAVQIGAAGVAQVDAALCMGCGVCESQCPDHVIHLVRDEQKAPPLDVRSLQLTDGPA